MGRFAWRTSDQRANLLSLARSEMLAQFANVVVMLSEDLFTRFTYFPDDGVFP